MKIKRSTGINLILLVMMGLAFLFPTDSLSYKLLLNTALFGLSGSLTNSLAIHMLFQRIPFIYGSGIIVLNFQQIKRDLEDLMIRQFFNGDQIQRFLTEEDSFNLDLTKVESALDLSSLFDKFKTSISNNFQSNPMMLLILPLLESNREKITQAMAEALHEQLENPELQDKLKEMLPFDNHEIFEQKIRGLIQKRLDEMNPQAVKEVIQHMMENKFIWIVTWGAVIGAIMGAVITLLQESLFVILM